ncbi:MAG: hypothetical protein OJF55_000406 [Rhodanobacteraceae bacterium]|jgi:hypothetical protein|nr:MAG: hypothetical protein OJF55_000406 [Rhodanobacteraceae bacterium]
MRHFKWASLLAAVLLAACAQQPARESSARHEHAAIDYARYVQRTVPWFNFTSLYSWDSNQLGYVVVWVSPIQAYRLALVGPCLGLQSAAGVIGLTSQDGLVSSNRDAVLAGGDRCQIMRIEQLDAKAIRAVRSESKPSGDKRD